MPPTVPLPEIPVAGINPFRSFTSPGMFAYRQMQLHGLIQLPDFSGGDLSAEQRREALENAVGFMQPLAAMIISLSVVAIEDFVRDLGARMADSQLLQKEFPCISGLRMEQVPPRNAFSRLDRDPASLTDPAAVNRLFKNALNVEPIDPQHFDRFRDLALIRHTVAHHMGVIRAIDAPRFQYYIVRPNAVVNPPIGFVKETCQYLYEIGRSFEKSLRDQVFGAIVPKLSPGWRTNPPSELIELIELFNYFDKLIPSHSLVIPPPGEEARFRVQESARMRRELVDLCLSDLATRFP